MYAYAAQGATQSAQHYPPPTYLPTHHQLGSTSQLASPIAAGGSITIGQHHLQHSGHSLHQIEPQLTDLSTQSKRRR